MIPKAIQDRFRQQTSTNTTRNDTHLNYATFSELVVGMTLEQDNNYYYVARVNSKFVTLKNMRTDELIYEPVHFFNNAKYRKVSIQGNFTY